MPGDGDKFPTVIYRTPYVDKADYTPGEEIEMTFSFDEHAFLIQKGGKLRVDISSSAFPLYVPHTNRRGMFCEQKTAKVATNTVDLGKSFLELPVDTKA